MAIREEPPSGPADWVVTFGDLMALLLTFFILLFSMSELKSDKQFQAMAEAMRKQFGYSLSARTRIPGQRVPLHSRLERQGNEQWAVQENQQNARSKTRMKSPDRQPLWMTRAPEAAAYGTILVFDGDSLELTPRHKEQLHILAEELQGKPNKIEVRGHALGRPPDSQAADLDDWDLAFRRAQATAQFLIEQEGIDRRRFRLGVSGRNDPLYSSADPVLMSRNSRVEVYLLGELADPFDGAETEP
jgi:chemotaxis protein MotB